MPSANKTIHAKGGVSFGRLKKITKGNCSINGHSFQSKFLSSSGSFKRFVFDEFDLVERRKTIWVIREEDFFDPDYTTVKLKNRSGSTFFYQGRNDTAFIGVIGMPIKNGKLGSSVILSNDIIDYPVPESPIRRGEFVNLTTINPLSFIQYKIGKRWHNFEFQKENADLFFNEFNTIIGDSISISFFLSSRSLRFSNYKWQEICSEPIVISTKRIFKHWEN